MSIKSAPKKQADIEGHLLSHPKVKKALSFEVAQSSEKSLTLSLVQLKKHARLSEIELHLFLTKIESQSPHQIIILDSLKNYKAPSQEALAKLLEQHTKAEQNTPLYIGNPLCLSFSFSYKLETQFSNLDTWLYEVLHIPRTFQLLEPPIQADDKIQQFLVRGISLFKELLISAYVPCFQDPVLKNLKQIDESKWHCQIELPTIHAFDPHLFSNAILEVLKVLDWMNGHPYEKQLLPKMQHYLKTTFNQPIKNLTATGLSTIPLLQTAYDLNIPFKHLGGSLYQIGWGANQRRLDRSSNEKDSVIGLKLSSNKLLTANLVRDAGLPAPTHIKVEDLPSAQQALQKLGWPVVIKPVDLERGEGVTVHIDNEQSFQQAFNHALEKSKSNQVLIEQKVSGVCHRLLISNGQLIYAVKRLPRSVQGDGKNTVQQLIHLDSEKELAKLPWKRYPAIPLDSETQNCLKQQNLSLEAIPNKGHWITLRYIESSEWGGRDEDISNKIHPENLRIAQQAQRLFNLETAGIDIILQDISQPWYSQGGIINEVNYAPMFGAGDISLAAMPKFYEHFINHQGRIPIYLFMGQQQAMQQALQLQNQLQQQNINCYLTSHQVTLAPQQQEMVMPINSLFKRTQALLMNNQVQALCLVIQNDEVLSHGLPVDKANRFTLTEESLINAKNEIISEDIRHEILKRYQRILF